jgi:hypothetical protein
MPQSLQDQPHDGNPTAAEIFRVFRNTTVASIEALRLLLEECTGLRADLVTVHGLHSDGEGDGVFSARQQNRILELQKTAMEIEALLGSSPHELATGHPCIMAIWHQLI